MIPRPEIRAFPGQGLEDDRYAMNRGFWSDKRPAIRHVSLISKAAIDAANRELEMAGLAPFAPIETRRNILISRDFDFSSAREGTTVRIGPSVILRYAEVCTPCKRPSELSGKSLFEKYFRQDNRGGIRAAVINGGTISVGDEVFVDL